MGPPVTRLLTENVSESFMFFCLLHKLTIGFAVVGVINGVFMQETFKVAAMDDLNMVRQKERAMKKHAEKMTKLFLAADSSGDGYLDAEEFRGVMNDPGVRLWLSSMDIDAADADVLFGLLDTGDGSLELKEIIQGVSRLKGPARSLDLNVLMRDLKLAGVLPGP